MTLPHTTPPLARRSLQAANPRRWDVPLLLLVATGCLITGQVLPGVTLRIIATPTEHYSVMGGVIDLWETEQPILAVILFSFSILFPTVKLFALALLWWRPMDPRRRAVWGHRLKVLGKWSMLDTFVVIVLIGTVKLSKVVTVALAETEPAVYFFAVAILLSQVLTFVVTRLADAGGAGKHVIPKLDVSLVIAPWLAAGLLIASLFQPVMHVEKRMLTNTYAVPDGIRELIASGELFLATVMGFLVVVLPLVYFLGLGWTALRQLRGRDVGVHLSRLVVIERWAMVDVCMLGIWLVYSKVIGIAETDRLAAYWLMAAAGALSVYCAIRVRRVY